MKLCGPHLASLRLTSPRLTSPHLASPLLTTPQFYHAADYTIGYFLLFLDCSYTAILKKSMGVLLCEGFAGEHYLVEDPNTLCYTPAHNVMRAVGVIMLIVVGIGYPFFTTYYLTHDMNKLGMPSAKSFRRYTFLFDAFKGPRLSWWNAFQCFRNGQHNEIEIN